MFTQFQKYQNKLLISGFTLGWLLFSFVSSVKAQDYCEFLKQVKTYQKAVKFELVEGELPAIDYSTFEINDYLEIYDKVLLPSNLTCGLHSNYQHHGFSPKLYITNKHFSIKDFINRKIENKQQELDTLRLDKNIRKKRLKSFTYQIKKDPLDFYANDTTNHAKYHFTPDDSEEGFLQYLYLHEMGEEFALFMHSNIGKKDVVCSEEDVTKYVAYFEKTYLFSCELDKFRSLLYANLQPKIEFKQDKCIIQWFEIWTHRGVFLRTYSIERNPPYKISVVDEEKVVDIMHNFYTRRR